MSRQQRLEDAARHARMVMRTASIFITDPAQASTVPDLYDYWARGDWALYRLHTVVRTRDERLWRFNQPSLANETQNMEPGSAGSEALWSMIDYRDGYRVIPDTITSTTAFALNELGYWHGSAQAGEGIYRSGQAGNAHVPGTTGAAWTLVEAYRQPGDGGGTTEPETPTVDEWSVWVQPTGGHDAYKAGAQVTHNGKRWTNTHGNGNSWAPGVYGWTEVA